MRMHGGRTMLDLGFDLTNPKVSVVLKIINNFIYDFLASLLIKLVIIPPTFK